MASPNQTDQKPASDQPDPTKGQDATQKEAAEGEKQPGQANEQGVPGPKVLPTHYRGMPKDWEKNRERKFCHRALPWRGLLASGVPGAWLHLLTMGRESRKEGSLKSSPISTRV